MVRTNILAVGVVLLAIAGGAAVVGQRPSTPDVPAIAAPTGVLVEQVAPLGELLAEHADAGGKLAAYFVAFRDLVAAHPQRFPHALAVQKQYEASIDAYMATLRPDRPVPGLADALTAAIEAVFGADAERELSPAEIRQRLEALAWACGQ